MSEVSPNPVSQPMRIVAITADESFEQLLRATFGRNGQLDLIIIAGAVGGTEQKVPVETATVLLVDLDASRPDEIAALQNLARRLSGSVPLLVVTTGFSEFVARPPDGEAWRYNKVGTALDVSHVQLSRYLSTADYALREAMAAKLVQGPTTTTRIYARQELTFDRQILKDSLDHKGAIG